MDNPVTNSRIKCIYPDIQKNIIGISSEMVREYIIRACNDWILCLIDDEATDVSTHEQVSVCVRFVEYTGDKVILREECLSFVRASKTTSENLDELF
jgi:hypothetical protein